MQLGLGHCWTNVPTRAAIRADGGEAMGQSWIWNRAMLRNNRDIVLGGCLQLRLQDAVRGAMLRSSMHVHGKSRNSFGTQAGCEMLQKLSNCGHIWNKNGWHDESAVNRFADSNQMPFLGLTCASEFGECCSTTRRVLLTQACELI